VSLTLPTATASVESNCRVVRVELADENAEQQLPGIGVEFERFAGQGETELITFLASQDRSSPRRTTVIMEAPPKVDT